ncbi:SDR family oxidoreductase [Fictibacillus iocasae]|uniref:SDR family oxidoreductase n=1 Tax=Fictibacillus iocasae TaxID=2715437 RepID=A0ABW2NVG6_9BACL
MNIFLTGATGFLGGKLVRGLAEQGHTLYILARNMNKASELLASIDTNDASIHIVQGDITRENLGLSSEQLEDLTGEVDVFYHMAALVKFDANLHEELHQINFEGTRHALETAKLVQTKRFLYVSTAYTLGTREFGEEMLYPITGPFNNPYEESKCKAEHLVFQYEKHFEVLILRPAIIIGDSETGEADSQFTMYGLMRSLEVFKKKMERKQKGSQVFRLLCEPDSTQNLVPVDYVANVLHEAIVFGEDGAIYNITSSTPPNSIIALTIICERLGIDNITAAPFEDEHRLTGEERSLNDMISVYRNYLTRNIQFINKNTAAMLKQAGKQVLKMDDDMLKRIVRGYEKSVK